MSGVFGGVLGGALPQQYECSRAGCGAAAVRAIRWRNPKIHDADRRKIWLACEEHLDYLREFLAARSFPLEVVMVSELGVTVATSGSAPERGIRPDHAGAVDEESGIRE